MNSYERVKNRLEGKPVDRLPNMCITMAFAAKLVNASYKEFVSDYRILADAAWKVYELYHVDMVCAISDPMREAEAFGAKIIFPDNNVPYAAEPRVKDLRDICTLHCTDPASSHRMNDRLEAVRLLSKRAQKEVPVVGWVEGAIAESCDLMGVSELLVNLLDEPEAIAELLEICLEQAQSFAIAQLDAGADIIGVGDAASSLLGPELYQEFALPYQQRLIQTIHQHGGKVKLHICGDLNPVLPYVAQTNADIIDLDYMVDVELAAKHIKNSASICGNFDPVSIMLQGCSQDVFAAVQKMHSFRTQNYNFVSAGCEIPRDTPVENLLSVYEELQRLAY